MTEQTSNDEVDEQAGDLTAAIKRIEVANILIDLPKNASVDFDYDDVSDRYDDPRVRIIFENGGILQIRQTEDMDVPVEESFKPSDPHSVWERRKLNDFCYEEDWDAAQRVKIAAEWNLEDMAKRDADDDLSDWETLQNCLMEADT